MAEGVDTLENEEQLRLGGGVAVLTRSVLWAELFPSKRYVGVLTPAPQNATLFGKKVFTEITKLK